MLFARHGPVQVRGQVMLETPPRATEGERRRRIRGKVADKHTDAAECEYPVAAGVEPPAVPVVDVVVPREVGLDRVTVLAQETQQARYSPEVSRPITSA